MNVFFILLLCEKKLCDCRSEKKNDVTHYERNANCFLYFKKTTTIKSFLNKV